MSEVSVSIHIGPAAQHHFPALREIELASFETLREAGAVAGPAQASSDEELQQYLNAGFLVGAFDGAGIPVGFGGGYVADGWLHVAEVDVHPDWQRRGIGRRLMAALLDDARARSLMGATLTTDRFAAFNAAFYLSLGFEPLARDACPTRLQAILAAEEGRGLDPRRRVAMVHKFAGKPAR